MSFIQGWLKMSKDNKKFELNIVKTANDINYEKPAHPNNLVNDSEYSKIDSAISTGVALTNAGTTLVCEDSMSVLLAENKKDTRYIVDNKISDSEKVTINNKKYIKSPAVVAETLRRAEEHSDATKRAKNSYASQSIVNISNSSDTKAQKCDYEDYAKKAEKNLGRTRINQNNISEDEITGKPLVGNGNFHHANKKTIYTDPVQRLDPDKGVVVNSDTHSDVHRNNINDENSLAEYAKRKNNNCL